MMRWLVLCTVCAALTACKGKTVVKDNPETLRQLEDCAKSRQEKDKYIAQLKERVGELELRAANNEVVVTITGDEMAISSKGGGAPPKAGNALNRQQIESMIQQINASRGAMQRCYQTELKKNSSLQVRPVDINIQVRLTSKGKVSRATFRPTLSNSFSICMRSVAQKWQVSGASGGVIQRMIKLTPQ